MSKRWIGLVLLVPVLGACATVPPGPNVMVLPGSTKTFEQFQQDDAICRQWAGASTGMSPGDAATNSAVTSGAVGTILGAAAGAAIGAAAGNPALGAAAGAGGGLLFGSAAGASAGSYAGMTLQRRYDIAYVQCMYAKGNLVPGV
ncbi:MAG TPA: glycine zipper family protein, partial [Candidatus Methylomirabilis sp.]|nr:glycine zipper family protein [Candidatus Methylomirabilis sp.]